MHSKSVTAALPLPPYVPEFLEEIEGDERQEPQLTTWIGPQDELRFAGLQFIDGAQWLLRGVAIRGETSGLLEIRQLAVEPWKHRGEVTGKVLRLLRPAEIRAAAGENLGFMGDEPEIAFSGRSAPVRVFRSEEKAARRTLIEASTNPRKRGRPRLPDSHYRRVALEYLELYEGGSPRVLKDLAERRGVQWQTVRDWVARARQLGYLTRGKQGRAGARPGPRLLGESDRAA